MKLCEELKYSKEHVWVRVEGGKAFVGISDFAQESLGDIVFLELPAVGTEVSAGSSFVSIESVKTTSEVYAPVTGVIAEVNEEIEDDLEKVNVDPYNSWFVTIEYSNEEELSELMDAEDYRAFVEK